MKRLLIIISMATIVFADSPVGNWKLSGLRVDYFDIARAPAQLVLTDAYGFGISTSIADIPAGALFNVTVNGPFTDAVLQAAGINLNVNLYPDGTGVVGEGSYYPDVDLVPGQCITQGQIFPITDTFNWENSGGQVGNTFPYVNLIGIPSANSKAGELAYGLGVNGSGVFDNWPSEPTSIPTPSVLPAIATADGNLALGCLGICASGAAGPFDECMVGCSAQPAAYGAMLPGAHGGYFRAGDLGESQIPGNTANDVKFLLEWSAIDGPESLSGLGDVVGEDEDGDGTDYDRIFGIPYVTSTYVNTSNPLCDISGGALTGAGAGLVYPVAGDIVAQLGGVDQVAGLITGLCVEGTEALCVEAGGAAELVWAGCMDAVVPSVEGLCDAAGTPQAAVAGLCFETSQDPALLATCEYAGVDATVVGACMQLGFDAETCAQAGGIATSGIADACESGVIAGAEAACEGAGGLWNTLYGGCLAQGADEATCMAAADAGVAGYGDCATWAGASYAGSTCADAGTSDCAVLVSSEFATEMCAFIGYTLTTSETCNEWAWSVADGFAAQSPDTGYLTCTQAAEGATGIPMGSGTAYCGAAADALFALQTGVSCSQYGAGYTIPVADGGLGCIDSVSPATTMYLMDPSLAAWGLFLTYNAASVQQYLAAGYDLATVMAYFPELFVNDSASDFDPGCYATGYPVNCGGRLVMDFAPTCVAEVESHQIVAEFVDLDALGCEGTGDVAGGFDDIACSWNPNSDVESCDCIDDDGSGVLDEDEICLGDGYQDEFEGPAGDGVVNVVDVVKLVGHILGTSPLGGYLLCEADLNGDSVVNVVDVVGIVNIILGGGLSLGNDATQTTINYSDTEISLDADGYVGAIDMTIVFDGKFSLEINERFTSDYIVNGNSVHAVIVGINDELIGGDDALINYEGKILSITAEAANSKELTDVTVKSDDQPFAFEIKDAYPNPFNPSTTLEMTLDKQTNVSIKVYSLTGQLVDVISEGSYTPGNHTFTWNANDLASGVYFISTEAGNTINNQKVMLIK